MKKVRVEVGERSYDIRIAGDLEFGEAVDKMSGRRALLVTDSNVEPLYADSVQGSLKICGIESSRIVLPAGEASKCMGNMEVIYNAALDAGLDRKSLILALGGGMTGDIAGFAAATYMRGVKFLQVPTTLLAMVDSSVGGKTAVNLDRGKNLVGSFYQPIEVDAWLSSLKTLPDREFSAGMAEVIKYGVIWDAEFLAYLEENIGPIMAKDEEILSRVIYRCCEIKAEVVAVDEREAGVRGILNFGHTLAHSVENSMGYGECLHGEAVAVGMVFALRLSVLQKAMDPESESRVRRLLKAAGLPVYVNDLTNSLSWQDLRNLMQSDKKTVSGVPQFVLAERMGAVVFGCEVPEDMLSGAYNALLEESV